MKKSSIFLICLFLVVGNLKAQDLNWSHGLKTSIFFGNKFRFLISYNVNVRADIEIDRQKSAIPFVDLKVNLFHNHLGTNVLQPGRGFFAGVALTPGVLYGSGQDSLSNDHSFVTIFSPAHSNTVSTGYNLNIGFGSTYHLLFTRSNIIQTKVQRVGNVIFGYKGAYFSYYNDGGPVLKWFGDKYDRYFTGGMVAGYQNSAKRLEVSFEKFTGFYPGAFEALSLLHVDNVIYRDEEQVGMNTGLLSFTYLDLSRRLGGSLNVWNVPFDLQDFIHRDISNNPYHQKIEKSYVDFEIFYQHQ